MKHPLGFHLVAAFAIGCADTEQKAQKAWLGQMVANVRGGQEIPRFFPPPPANASKQLAPDPPEFVEATAAIRESTGLEIDKDVWGAQGLSCINSKVTSPKGARTIAFILEHHGERNSAASLVTNTVQRIGVDRTCTCSGRREKAVCSLLPK